MPKLKQFVIDNLLLPLVGVAAVLLLWTVVSHLTVHPKTGEADFPSPTQTWELSRQYLAHPFTENEEEGYRGVGLEVLDSLRLVALGYGLALLVAVPVGFLLGGSKTFARMFDPIFQVLRPVSPLAWFPIAGLVMITIQRAAKAHEIKIDAVEWQCVFTIAICAVWPTILNTAVGVRAIPQDYLNVARVLRLSPLQRFAKVLLPATMPYMFTGFRLSLGIAWLVIVAAEMLAGKAGVGYFLWNSYNGPNYGAMLMSVIVIGGVGFVLDRLMSVAERHANDVLALPGHVGRLVAKLRTPAVQPSTEVPHVAA